MKSSRFLPLALILLFGVAPILQSCSGQQEKETTVTTTTSGPAAQGTPAAQPTTVTTVTTTETPQSHQESVLGATMNAVVTTAMFPFRLISDAIGLLL
jgi:hypothetical protein